MVHNDEADEQPIAVDTTGGDVGASQCIGHGSSSPKPQAQSRLILCPSLSSGGPRTYAPYTYNTYPGVFSLYSSITSIPTIAYFDSGYKRQIPHEDHFDASWVSSNVTNRLRDGLHAFL